MALRVISASALEAEVYLSNTDINGKIEEVGTLIMDLSEETPTMDILFIIPEEDENVRWQLCFGGSTLSMDFLPSNIAIVDFENNNDGDENVLKVFEANEVRQATQWLVNHLRA